MVVHIDRRDRMAGREKPDVCEDTMTMKVEWEDDEGEEQVTRMGFTWAVCGTCSGRGTHVNPSIDAHGITGEEFAQDPDFADDYFSGAYDVTCYECGGKRVAPALSPQSSEDERILERLAEKAQADWEYEQECAMERMMGC